GNLTLGIDVYSLRYPRRATRHEYTGRGPSPVRLEKPRLHAAFDAPWATSRLREPRPSQPGARLGRWTRFRHLCKFPRRPFGRYLAASVGSHGSFSYGATPPGVRNFDGDSSAYHRSPGDQHQHERDADRVRHVDGRRDRDAD